MKKRSLEQCPQRRYGICTGETYTVTLDGFIISDNVECTKYENVNTGYSYSDHDPVYMEFYLKK